MSHGVARGGPKSLAGILRDRFASCFCYDWMPWREGPAWGRGSELGRAVWERLAEGRKEGVHWTQRRETLALDSVPRRGSCLST